MWLWRFILGHLAKAKGFLDPTVVFSNLQHFSKPSEVWVPVELLRSGAVLQARGLINSQAIQNNLDWVWPFWVERQFDPRDKAFVPRAFSLTHINLTHRNWTAIGLPDFSDLPIVDPCGLVTPFFDGWSVDAWIVHDKDLFAPSRLTDVGQNLDLEGTLAVLTASRSEKFMLAARAEVKRKDEAICTITFSAQAREKAWLLVCVRPYNPEGISFIHEISCLEKEEGWMVNKTRAVYIDKKPSRYIFANYSSGDLCIRESWDRSEGPDRNSITCKTGMATSAAAFALEHNQAVQVTVSIPLSKNGAAHLKGWPEHLSEVCGIKVPDERFEFLYNAAIRSMILHAPGDVYPGPFTYKRFWFRDAAFILQAMMATGLFKNIEKIIDHFAPRQTPTGYFMSQDGEWDSNGQAIWAMKRFIDITRHVMKPQWLASINRAAGWIQRKRRVFLPGNDPLHTGLLPAGFSAEHFGPSDFYYWDDYWSVTGLRDASSLIRSKDTLLADTFRNEADGLMNAIDDSITLAQKNLQHPGIPASPSRRMDAGAIGSLVASYPLQLYAADDERMRQTVKFLMDKYFLQGAFYHEISHSGINIYLSLHIAQVLLRAGNPKFFSIVKAVADLASGTGQWPEAIHPRTKGGCMGDGQHIWASAEWVMMLRNMFVREEEAQRTLILCSGLPEEWLTHKETLRLGPTYTLYGQITVAVKCTEEYIEISWEAGWHEDPPRIEIRLLGHEPHVPQVGETKVKINRKEALV